MDRRVLITSGLSLVASACATTSPGPGARQGVGPNPNAPPQSVQNGYPAAEPYSAEELAAKASDFFGVTAEAAGGVIQRAFADNGQPTGYIAGQEGSGALTIGARYGKGLLYMKNRPTTEVFWQGPTLGWDVGGNASRVFTLVYGMNDPNQVFQRFPGVEGTAYLVGGMGVNYQRGGGIVLAPIRAGVGLRLGANIGYLSYSRKRNIIPF
jgi:hypothetical protein